MSTKTGQIQTSKVFIWNVKRGGEKWLDRIITMDETWLHHFDRETKPESIIWKHIVETDNPPALTAASTCLEIDLLGFDLLEQPPYSPNLAPMDLTLFPFIKSQLRGVRFEDSDEHKNATRAIVSKIDSKWYSNVFNSWLRRCEKCLQCKGDCVKK